MTLAPIIGATIGAEMEFRHRVAWYAVWIQAYPLQHIHFLHTKWNSGFLSESTYQLI